jgi:hypothetical protein
LILSISFIVLRNYTPIEANLSPYQFVIPLEQFMMKEIKIVASMSYTDEDFLETVEAFSAGMYYESYLQKPY